MDALPPWHPAIPKGARHRSVNRELTKNERLFSDHYLATRLPEEPECDDECAPQRDQLRLLLTHKLPALDTLNEAQTENQFIRPVFNVLNWNY